ncbi:unnamed protein product [Lupinus luteus]|uniref:Transcription factor IIIC 90kDa subunit N-terminal domain-containing protein n=1 Tax=Lupinus luteus TaxID=3873 RepID=A0AAV1W2A8_LUPLU
MASPTPLQPAMLLGSPSYPNAIAWSDENLIAVASGHIVTILKPESPNGPRGVIKISASEPLPIGLVERKDLLSGCLLSTCLYRDEKPGVRSISWSPVGIAPNSGCLIAVCTTEGHVKIYRPPFCDFCAEWIEVVDITEMLYGYLQCTEFQDNGIPSIEVSKVPKPNRKSLKEMPENCNLPLISAGQYASRSAMMCSLVISWSPLLHVASELYPAPNTCSSFSLLAVGGKSGKVSLWRFCSPDCYTIEDNKVPTAVEFVEMLQAHNSWVTTLSWLFLDFDASNPQILLATGSSDGSVKVWLGDNEKLLKSSGTDQSPFVLVEVINGNAVPISVISVTAHVQYPSKMLLAIGKASGSFEIWLCDIHSREFDKLGSYNVHDYVVTSLAWAFGGRFLYSCSQDNVVHSWILREKHLDEVTIVSDMPRANNATTVTRDAFDSCYGAAVSPGNLVIATVHCFDVEKLNRMYEGRILRAAIEFFWIGGLQVNVWLKSPYSFYIEEHLSFPEKELTYWGANILWSLNQFQHVDKSLVLWDVIAALLAFKDSKSKYVEDLLIKWLSLSFLRSHKDLPTEKVLSFVSSSFSDIPSRLLHLLNIICRRVMLSELDADQVSRINSKVQNLEGVCPAMEKQITKWVEILLSSERELRERLVGFSLLNFRSSTSFPEASISRSSCWRPVGLAQMEQWIALDQDHVRDQLKVIASEVNHDKSRFTPSKCLATEQCSFCSAPVLFESPEVGFCQAENCSSGNGKCHRLLRCAVSMQVCPITPLWFCVCCHRSAFRLTPEPLFRMSSFHVDLDSSTKSSSEAVSSKPLCSFCGILLQRQQPDFLLSPMPV